MSDLNPSKKEVCASKLIDALLQEGFNKNLIKISQNGPTAGIVVSTYECSLRSNHYSQRLLIETCIKVYVDLTCQISKTLHVANKIRSYDLSRHLKRLSNPFWVRH